MDDHKFKSQFIFTEVLFALFEGVALHFLNCMKCVLITGEKGERCWCIARWANQGVLQRLDSKIRRSADQNPFLRK